MQNTIVCRPRRVTLKLCAGQLYSIACQWQPLITIIIFVIMILISISIVAFQWKNHEINTTIMSPICSDNPLWLCNVSYNLPQPTRRAVQQVGVWSWQVQGFRHGKPRYYQGKHFVNLNIISKKLDLNPRSMKRFSNMLGCSGYNWLNLDNFELLPRSA